jgi:hypothetical protein
VVYFLLLLELHKLLLHLILLIFLVLFHKLDYYLHLHHLLM